MRLNVFDLLKFG